MFNCPPNHLFRHAVCHLAKLGDANPAGKAAHD